jgi:hypothetical protein
MRRIVEPPPSSQCDGCGGQLKLKRVETNGTCLALAKNIFACEKCGKERLFVTQQDLYASGSVSRQRMMGAMK